MKRLLVLVMALSAATLTTQYAMSVGSPDEKPPIQQPAQQPVVAPNAMIRPQHSNVGTVTQIGPDSITISFHATVETEVNLDPDGRAVSFTDRLIPAAPPETFKFAQSLIDGKPGKCFGESFSYRITDVQVGDHVMIGRSSLNGVDYCHMICIYRRPGGKIPPAPDDKKGKYVHRKYQWHEYYQARQDFEEKGIPIPDKFLPESERKSIPMPREVKNPRIPDAEP
jgi:hypothetical protein